MNLTDQDRVKILQNAIDHQFDEDDNADLEIATDDVLLRAAVAAVNEFGAWHEVSIAPDAELFKLLGLVGHA
jgi:hypothetical protein